MSVRTLQKHQEDRVEFTLGKRKFKLLKNICHKSLPIPDLEELNNLFFQKVSRWGNIKHCLKRRLALATGYDAANIASFGLNLALVATAPALGFTLAARAGVGLSSLYSLVQGLSFSALELWELYSRKFYCIERMRWIKDKSLKKIIEDAPELKKQTERKGWLKPYDRENATLTFSLHMNNQSSELSIPKARFENLSGSIDVQLPSSTENTTHVTDLKITSNLYLLTKVTEVSAESPESSCLKPDDIQKLPEYTPHDPKLMNEAIDTYKKLSTNLITVPFQNQKPLDFPSSKEFVLLEEENMLSLPLPKELVRFIEQTIEHIRKSLEYRTIGTLQRSYSIAYNKELKTYEFILSHSSKQQPNKVVSQDVLVSFDKQTVHAFREPGVDEHGRANGKIHWKDFIIQVATGKPGIPGKGSYTLPNGIVVPKEYTFVGLCEIWKSIPDRNVHINSKHYTPETVEQIITTPREPMRLTADGFQLFRESIELDSSTRQAISEINKTYYLMRGWMQLMTSMTKKQTNSICIAATASPL